MSQLRKRGNIWHLYYWKNGKLHGQSTHTPDRQAARIRQVRLDNELLNSKHTDIKYKPAWSSFCAAYMEYSRANKRPRSVMRDLKTIKMFTNVVKIDQFCDFEYKTLEAYKAKRKDMGVTEATINRELNTLKAMGKWAVKARYSSIDPVAGVRKYTEQQTSRDRFLTLDEIKLLLDKPRSQQVRTIIRLQLWGAMRLGEALHMAWCDVDFEKNLVYFTPKEGWKPKTSQKQVIPLNKNLKTYLKSLPSTNTHYICGPDPMTEESASTVISKVLKSLGIKGATSHTLRHTAISWAAMSGMDFPSLVRFARHTNPKQTMRYTHLMPSYAQNQVDKLPY